MKIVISDKLYIKLTEEQLELVRPRFTHTIYVQPNKPPRFMYRFGHIANGTYWFPKNARNILEECGIEITEVVEKRISVPVLIPEPTFTLRPDQQEIVDSFGESGLINGKPGWGKSIAGLAVAHKLQQKTLIVTTTTVIRDMWVKEIKKFFGFDAGVVGSGQFNIEPPIVVGNIQTVNKKAVELASVFGLVIGDEIHHTPASTFLSLFDRNKAKHFLGLSGTLKRKDGLEVLIPGIFGPDLFIPPEINTIKPTVHRYNTAIEFSSNNMIPWALRVNELMENPTYIDFVDNLVDVYVGLGHKVLVVGDRLEFLNTLHEEYKGKSKYIITGQKDHKTLEYRNQVMAEVAKGPPCPLYASTSIFAEGVSLNELSVVIVTAPTNNESLIEQIAGRVQRITVDKEECIYVDITFKGTTGRKHSIERSAIFAKNSWETIIMDAKQLSILAEKRAK